MRPNEAIGPAAARAMLMTCRPRANDADKWRRFDWRRDRLLLFDWIIFCVCECVSIGSFKIATHLPWLSWSRILFVRKLSSASFFFQLSSKLPVPDW